MVKKLVFFLYIGEHISSEEYQEKYPTMKLHFKLLKMYSHVFDEAVFVLSLKKELMDDEDLIKHYMNAIIDIGFCNVRFKVEENTLFRESKIFKEEVIENIDNNGKLVFFGHSKGISNEYNDSLVRLICSMYYFNLNFIDEVENELSTNWRPYFGFPLINAKWNDGWPTCVMPLYKYFFYGTFFWTNWSALNEAMKRDGREFPTMASRFYDENFPANTIPFEAVGTHKNTYGLSGRNLHYEFDDFFNEYCEYAPDGETTKNEFNDFVKEITGTEYD